MKIFLNRFLKLIFGLFLYSLGIVITINANIGYAPWEVFHVGFSKTIGISIGNISILTGLVIIIITAILGEKFGIGTILNMILIGVFLDIIMYLNIIPKSNNFLIGLLMLILGLFVISLASYFYISSSFGAGPRDSLMVALSRKTNLPIGLCRASLEILVVIIGYCLGGLFGIGTIISAFLIGFCIQTTFKFFNFDATQIEHETLYLTYEFITKNIKKTS